MKKVFLIIAILVLFALPVHAADPSNSQVSCSGTIATLYAGAHQSTDVSNLSVSFQVFTAGVTVYIGTSATLTAATAGLALSSTGILAYIAEHKREAWYCITSGSSATVGVAVTP